MAELVEEVALVEPVDGGVVHGRISWGAVFAGAVTTIGIWMLLYVFGLAIGASTLNVQSPGSAKATGIFAGVWGVVAPLVALFVGGVVAGRGSGVARPADGGVHGLVTWGLAAVAGAWLVTAVMAVVAGGLTSAGWGAARAATSALGNDPAAVGRALHSAGLNAETVVGPLNQRLEGQGRPAVSPDQLEAAARDALDTSMREGRFDRTVLVQALARNTQLSATDARQLADQISDQLQGALARLTAEIQSATKVASAALWGTFVALALGLIAAVFGGVAGVGGARRRGPRREKVLAPLPAGRAPAGTPREVYP